MRQLVQAGEAKNKKSSLFYSFGFLVVLGIAVQSYLPQFNLSTKPNPEVQLVSAQVETAQTQATTSSLIATKVNDVAMTATIAETAALPVATEAAIASTVAAAEEEIAQTTQAVVDKPAIVSIDQVVTGIQLHKVKSGDKIADLANQYGVSEQTIRWANDLESSKEPTADTTMKIPPVDGLIYKVRADDSVDRLATKYKASAQRLITYNNLEAVSSLPSGQEIIIPGGVLPENERPGYQALAIVTAAPVRAPAYSSYNYSANGGGGRFGLSTIGYGGATSGGNRYAYGNCTWYSYERRLKLGRPIGGLWGNATSWASSARANGFTVNKTPAPGAIFQNHGGYGHVGVVEKVYPNGDIYVTEMNYQGYNVISGATIKAAYVSNYNYIH